ncbi:putative transcriptional regulatory protein, partial [Colletotrichum shisoi]
MVGVPGRSKGCNTCRKRKKGCDLQRPTCGQCLKAGIECAGYERKRIFVNLTTPGEAGWASKALVPVVREVTQAPSLSQSAFEDKIFDLFWEGYMPEAPLWAPASPIVRFANADWATAVRDLYRTDTALRQSLLALGLGTIGRRDKQQWMVDDGLKFCCDALRELNVGLRHPRRWKSDALILASRILGFYEIISHVKRRRRCPLSHPVWKTVPWQTTPKTPKDVLVDIFVDVPGLLEDLDRLRSCQDDAVKERRRSRLVKECWRLDGELQWWLSNLSPEKELQELMARGLDNPAACDVVVASVMALCWTVSLLTYSTLRLALGAKAKAGLELPERTDPLVYCVKIADIVDVFFHPSAGTFGIQSAPLPIGMALMYLNSSEQWSDSETKWKLLGFFGRTANNGIVIGKFLLSTQRDGLAAKTGAPATPDGIRAKAKGWMGVAA